MEGAFAPAGSFFVFGGALQHGSIGRTNPGLRVSINSYFCQPYVVPQEHLQGQLATVSTLGRLARQLVWGDAQTGWGKNGPAYLPTPYADGLPKDGFGLLDPAVFGNDAFGNE